MYGERAERTEVSLDGRRLLTERQRPEVRGGGAGTERVGVGAMEVRGKTMIRIGEWTELWRREAAASGAGLFVVR